jgi:hypothetical protein
MAETAHVTGNGLDACTLHGMAQASNSKIKNFIMGNQARTICGS